MGVAVDETGHDTPTGGVESFVGDGARRTDGDHTIAVEHDRCVTDDAQRALPRRRVVGDQHADVVDDDGHVTAPIAVRSSSVTSR